ncbi:FliM/FliN family flagellar motor switch protein [Thalassobius sp. S69A]|uniref:FliM/FliN family flagellar motor switch protein n=1 Tax=unclassified Thalassovita TaxID=2619711 RepID=UPI000C0C6E54|nr:hypothetical protein [Paracoccaceae bacterium]
MNNPNDILRRKAKAAKEGREAKLMSPSRALRRALTRAAELGLQLPLTVTSVEEETLERDALLPHIEEGGLIVTLERDAGPPGVIMLDMQLLSALVEVQTLGRVFDKMASARPMTRTDAAVAMPLIDGTLTCFDQLLDGQENAAPLAGYHFGAWLRDLRRLQAQLPDGEYTLFHAQALIGAGEGREGRLILALPVVAPAPQPETPGEPASASIREEVLDAPARLETVLHSAQMSLEQASALKPGDVLRLPLESLQEIHLHTGDRKIVATGVLGQIGGNRAVRLTGFGLPRVTGRKGKKDSRLGLERVDLADAGLVETPRARVPDTPLPPKNIVEPLQAKPGSQQQAKPIVQQAPPPVSEPAMQADLPAIAREDPTGTEALLSELGLSDLGDDVQMGSDALSLGALDEPAVGSDPLAAALPQPGGDG